VVVTSLTAADVTPIRVAFLGRASDYGREARGPQR
jgi:hypothetical protein